MVTEVSEVEGGGMLVPAEVTPAILRCLESGQHFVMHYAIESEMVDGVPVVSSYQFTGYELIPVDPKEQSNAL